MNNFSLLTKQNISIGLIWLFHVSGSIGIIYSDATWFLKATPINLLLSFVLLLINTRLNKKTSFILLLCFVTGMLAEIIGVKFGFLFGNYTYGDALGYKVLGVPLPNTFDCRQGMSTSALQTTCSWGVLRSLGFP